MVISLKTVMRKINQILATRTNRLDWHSHQRLAVAMTVFIAAAMLFIASCQRKPVMSHARFVHLPTAGWQQTLPLTFYPEYDDSTLTYQLDLAVRHNNSYSYSNLSLVVDIITADSIVKRQPVNLPLADDYGNWSGGGFGTLYQYRYTISRAVSPAKAHSVVVWQTMRDCDTLHGLLDVGLIVKPLHRQQ